MKLKLPKLFTSKNTSVIVEVLSILLIVVIAYIVFLNNSYGLNHYNNGDVHRGFQRGIDVLSGVNSYLAFNPDKMLTQEKVPGFFPLYFIFMALLAKLSNYSFVLFIDNLRYLIFVCYTCLGLIVYKHIREKGKLMALFAMVLFMFNRWTLIDVLALKQEAYVLLVLIMSLSLLKNHKSISYLLYGIATALKHLTILLLPIYIFDVLSTKLTISSLKKQVIYFCIFLIPIVIPAIPYIVHTPSNFVNAILFNVTRESESTSDGNLKTGFDKLLVLYSQDNINIGLLLLPRLPMIIALLMLTVIFFKKSLTMWDFAALTYGVFIAFNPTLFDQYFTWFFFFFAYALKDRVFTKTT